VVHGSWDARRAPGRLIVVAGIVVVIIRVVVAIPVVVVIAVRIARAGDRRRGRTSDRVNLPSANRARTRSVKPLLQTLFMTPVTARLALQNSVRVGIVVKTDRATRIAIRLLPLLECTSRQRINDMTRRRPRLDFSERRCKRQQAFIRRVEVLIAHKVAHIPSNPPLRSSGPPRSRHAPKGFIRKGRPPDLDRRESRTPGMLSACRRTCICRVRSESRLGRRKSIRSTQSTMPHCRQVYAWGRRIQRRLLPPAKRISPAGQRVPSIQAFDIAPRSVRVSPSRRVQLGRLRRRRRWCALANELADALKAICSDLAEQGNVTANRTGRRRSSRRPFTTNRGQV